MFATTTPGFAALFASVALEGPQPSEVFADLSAIEAFAAQIAEQQCKPDAVGLAFDSRVVAGLIMLNVMVWDLYAPYIQALIGDDRSLPELRAEVLRILQGWRHPAGSATGRNLRRLAGIDGDVASRPLRPTSPVASGAGSRSRSGSSLVRAERARRRRVACARGGVRGRPPPSHDAGTGSTRPMAKEVRGPVEQLLSVLSVVQRCSYSNPCGLHATLSELVKAL